LIRGASAAGAIFGGGAPLPGSAVTPSAAGVPDAPGGSALANQAVDALGAAAQRRLLPAVAPALSKHLARLALAPAQVGGMHPRTCAVQCVACVCVYVWRIL